MIDFNKPMFLDGATGSLLMSRGDYPAGFLMEKLNLSAPDTVAQLHKDYVAAGCELVYTNTFGANPLKLGEDVERIVRAGVDIALNSGAKYTALDIGTSGQFVGELGIPPEQATAEYARIIRAGENRTDAIVFETFMDAEDLRAALIAAKNNSRLPVMASLSFEKNGRTMFGSSVADLAGIAEEFGLAAVGINCGVGPKEMLPLAKELLSLTRLPVYVKPNAGYPRANPATGKVTYDITAEDFASAAAELYRAGVKIIGGCCGTTPEFMRMAIAAVQALR